MTIEPKLVGGTFFDRARARDAFDTLISDRGGGISDVDVVLYGSNGEYLLLVAVKSSGAEDWASRVLREHGADVMERRFGDWLLRARNELTHDVGQEDQRGSEEEALRDRWAAMAILLMQRGLVEPPDLLALMLTSRRVPDAVPEDEKRRGLREADEELREATKRLEAGLRARHPDLFDRRGRLRPAALARHLSKRTGGKEVLSGDELRVLEDAADAAAARSGRAP